MTDEEKIALLALMLGDIPGGPYYPMFTEEQYMQFLTLGKGDVNRSAVYAAISAGYLVSSESTREITGDIHVYKNTGANYIKLLDYLIQNVGKVPPPALMPWFGNDGCDNNKLLNYRVCDIATYQTFQNVWQGLSSGACKESCGC